MNGILIDQWQKLKTYEKFSFAVALSIAALGGYVTISTLFMVLRGWDSMPYWDQWDQLVSIRPDFWSHLFDQHNEHRIAIPRLVFWLDSKLSHETNIVNFCAIFLTQSLLAVLMFVVGRRAIAANATLNLWLFGIVGCLLFFAVQYENFLWGFQIQFVGILLAASTTFVATATWSSLRAALLIVALSAISTGMLASGVLVPILACLLACWLRRPWPYLLILGVAAVALPAIYLIGYHTPVGHSDPAAIFQHLTSVGAHLLAQLGGPFAGGSVEVALVVGALGLACFLTTAAFTIRLSKPNAPQASLFTLCLFILGAALLTAAGRERFGLEQAFASRYATPILLFWLSLILLSAALFMARVGKASAVVVISFPLALFVAVQQENEVDTGQDWSGSRMLGKGALVAGLRDPQIENTFYDINRLFQLRTALLQAKSTVFADEWTRWLGAPLSDHAEIVSNADCQGSIVSVNPFPGGWHINGSAAVEQNEKPLRRIVMVDSAGVITGYGFGGFSAHQLGIGVDSKPIFFAGAASAADRMPIRIFALQTDAGRETACFVTSVAPVDETVQLLSIPKDGINPGGYIDKFEHRGSHVAIGGWGLIGDEPTRVLLDTDLPLKAFFVRRVKRRDVVNALNDKNLEYSGIGLVLELETPLENLSGSRLCVWTKSAKYGDHRLQFPSGVNLCPN